MSNSLVNQTAFMDTDPRLVKPGSLTVDAGLPETVARHHVRLAQLLYTFWDTGDPAYLRRAVDPSFVDHTLPRGRPQGLSGPLQASAAFRAAVPDLTCELSDLLVTGPKLSVRLRFRGHFTGTFHGVRGKGQPIDFVAFDIQQIRGDRIVEDWHLEDNLTFLAQAGLVSVAGAPE